MHRTVSLRWLWAVGLCLTWLAGVTAPALAADSVKAEGMVFASRDEVANTVTGVVVQTDGGKTLTVKLDGKGEKLAALNGKRVSVEGVVEGRCVKVTEFVDLDKKLLEDTRKQTAKAQDNLVSGKRGQQGKKLSAIKPAAKSKADAKKKK